MNVTLDHIQLTTLSLNKFKEIYEDSFPVDERRPWDELKKLISTGNGFFKAFSILADSQFVGFITVWEFTEAIYIEHFATDKAFRGSGIGSKALNKLTSSATRPVVLEVETADTGDLARRRIEFYRRHGFRDRQDFHYIQPPYSPGLASLPMTLMIHGDLDPETARRLLYRHVYNAE